MIWVISPAVSQRTPCIKCAELPEQLLPASAPAGGGSSQDNWVASITPHSAGFSARSGADLLRVFPAAAQPGCLAPSRADSRQLAQRPALDRSSCTEWYRAR